MIVFKTIIIILFLLLIFVCIGTHNPKFKRGNYAIIYIVIKLFLVDKFFNNLNKMLTHFPSHYRINDYFIYSNSNNEISQCITRKGLKKLSNKNTISKLNILTYIDIDEILKSKEKFNKIIFYTNPSIMKNIIKTLKHKHYEITENSNTIKIVRNNTLLRTITIGPIVKSNQIYERLSIIKYRDFLKMLIRDRKNLIN